MENKLKNKFEEMSNGLNNFEESLNIDITSLSETIKDSVESGQIQKFEFCVELLWKAIKIYLDVNHGINVASPKFVFKELYNLGIINNEDYEMSLQMIDDRNLLSHIYKRSMMLEILNKLPNYLTLMKKNFVYIKKE